jgi:mannan endo-1,4-beta-mannosidase
MYTEYADPGRVDAVLNQAVSESVPLIIGEFGHQLRGVDVAWQQILTSCNELGLGYIAWSWMGNDAATAHLNLAEDWQGPLTAWGEDVISGPGGITATAQPASIFN